MEEFTNKSKSWTIVSKVQALEKLSSLVHPIVEEKFNKWCKKHEKKPYVLKEAAILFETGGYHDLDKIIHVFAPKEQRIQRVTREEISIEPYDSNWPQLFLLEHVEQLEFDGVNAGRLLQYASNHEVILGCVTPTRILHLVTVVRRLGVLGPIQHFQHAAAIEIAADDLGQVERKLDRQFGGIERDDRDRQRAVDTLGNFDGQGGSHRL